MTHDTITRAMLIGDHGHVHYKVDRYPKHDTEGERLDPDKVQVRRMPPNIKRWLDDYHEANFPENNVQVAIHMDGIYFFQHRVRSGGLWSEWGDISWWNANISPARTPDPPRLEILDNDGSLTVVRVHFNWERQDMEGNMLHSIAGMGIQALRPGADSVPPDDEWENKAYVPFDRNPKFYADIELVTEGRPQVRLKQEGSCGIWSRPSTPSYIEVNRNRPANAGEAHILGSCS